MANLDDGAGAPGPVSADLPTHSELVQQLAAANARVASLEAEFESFVYRASHDLQAPLRSVSSFCQLLERHYGAQLDEKGQKYLAFAVSGAQQGSQLVKSLLALSRAGRDATGPRGSTAAVMTKVLETLAADLAACDADVQVGDLPDVDVAEGVLTQLLAIFIDNAITYRGEGPPVIRVSGVRTQDGRVRLDVTDNGIGVDPKNLERIFDTFFRGDLGKRFGAGLGLAIARKWVAALDGSLTVKSTLGEGATFSVTLPGHAPLNERSE